MSDFTTTQRECGVPVYAQEAYAIGLAKRMYELAVEGLKGQS